MAFQAVPDAAEAVITFKADTKTYKNVVHGSKSGGYNLADLVALAAAVGASVVADWLPLMSADVDYVSTTVRGLAFENDQETVDIIGAGPGTVVSGDLPGNVTLSIKKSSELTGRSARGRLYWIGMPDTKIVGDPNTVLAIYADDVRDAVEAMRVAITASVWTAAIVSRFSGGVARDPGIFFEWRDTVLVNNNVDSMRRRLIN